jgi:hypothetical protein
MTSFDWKRRATGPLVLVLAFAGAGCSRNGDAAPGPGAGTGGSSPIGGAGGTPGPRDGSADGGMAGPEPLPPPPAKDGDVACKRTVNVAAPADLDGALAAVAAGDCLVLADGDYLFPTITAKGTEAEPVVIRAANTLGVRVPSGNLNLTGAAYVTVQGMMWPGSGTIKLTDCDHCRLSRFRIQRMENGDNDWITLTGTSHHCRIDHNDLGPQTQLANMVFLAGTTPQIVQYNRVDHNHFHDVHYTTGNGWEIIRAGLSQWTFASAHNIIEQNLFTATGSDPEVISVKSSDNVVRYNTMRGSAGDFTLRHGNRTVVYGNYILGGGVAGSGGIRVYGGAHRIFNNYVSDVSTPGINIDGGESDDTTGLLTDHKVSYDVQVMFNTVIGRRGIAVGSSKILKPMNVSVAYNIVQGAGPLISDTGGTMFVGNIANGPPGVTSGVVMMDPQLTMMGDVFKIGSGSPAIDLGDLSAYSFITDDIDGKPRTGKPDVGADEVSSSPPRFGVLKESDVGPMAP